MVTFLPKCGVSVVLDHFVVIWFVLLGSTPIPGAIFSIHDVITSRISAKCELRQFKDLVLTASSKTQGLPIQKECGIEQCLGSAQPQNSFAPQLSLLLLGMVAVCFTDAPTPFYNVPSPPQTSKVIIILIHKFGSGRIQFLHIMYFFSPQGSKFKVDAGNCWLSCFCINHVERKPLIQCNNVSTRQNVTWHWIVWILSVSPVNQSQSFWNS